MRIVDDPYYYLILSLSDIRDQFNETPKSKKSPLKNEETAKVIDHYGNSLLAELEPSEWLM